MSCVALAFDDADELLVVACVHEDDGEESLEGKTVEGTSPGWLVPMGCPASLEIQKPNGDHARVEEGIL